MSLSRQLFREFAPLFRVLEQPFGRTPALYGSRNWNRFDPFQEIEVRPAIDIAEQGDAYVLDAELPGVNKENVEVRVGDSGRSITIEGRVTDRASRTSAESSINDTQDTAPVGNREQPTQISTEREFTRNAHFTRTVWLPRPVDTQNITAKLENGVLSIFAKKAEDQATTAVHIQ